MEELAFDFSFDEKRTCHVHDGFKPQFPGSGVVMVVGVVAGVVVVVVVGPPVYSPGQYPLHSPHVVTSKSLPTTIPQLDTPFLLTHSCWKAPLYLNGKSHA